MHAFTHHYVIMPGGLKPKCSHENETKMQWKWKVEGSGRRDNTYRTSAYWYGREGVLKSAKLLLLIWDIIAGRGLKMIPRSCRPRLVVVADVV